MPCSSGEFLCSIQRFFPRFRSADSRRKNSATRLSHFLVAIGVFSFSFFSFWEPLAHAANALVANDVEKTADEIEAKEATTNAPLAAVDETPFRFQERVVQAALFSAVASGAALLSGNALGVVHHALTAFPVPPTLSLLVPLLGTPFFTFLLSAITLFPVASPLAVLSASVSSAFVVGGALLLLGLPSWQEGVVQGLGPNPNFEIGVALFIIPPVAAGVTAFGVGFLFSPPDDE
ncbi:MAG: hypothetical protein GY822_14910 [Deltaproteobacteria bacterium]|nr:hypothetical protein [Deltaproteobacteria bacterium]